jgi:hypothetical protein
MEFNSENREQDHKEIREYVKILIKNLQQVQGKSKEKSSQNFLLITKIILIAIQKVKDASGTT